mmetsp:Transcript_78544/g.138393  ORF Transcript_78544/g.138393 Transcript_78544/m.138393 type:complete len:531 (-) Transcript_78544:34-1626(-)
MRTAKDFFLCSLAGCGVFATSLALLILHPALIFTYLKRSNPCLQDGTQLQPWAVPSFPFGNLLQMNGDPLQVAQAKLRVASKQGGAIVTYLLTKATFQFVNNDEGVKELMGAKITVSKSFRNLGKVLPVWNRLFGRGLFMVSGEDWKRMHRICMRGFGPKQIQSFLPLVENQVKTSFCHLDTAVADGTDTALGLLAKREDNSVVLDPGVFFKQMALRVILAVAFGQDVPEEDKKILLQAMQVFESSGSDPLLTVPGFLNSPAKAAREVAAAIKGLHKVAHKLLARHRDGSDQKQDTLLAALLAAKDEDGSSLSEDDVVHNVYSFMAAGISTTSDTLCTTSFLLAQHPKVQLRLQQELLNMRTWEDIKDNAYLASVITESMRLWPSVAGLPARVLTEDAVIGGIPMQKGHAVGLDSIANQRRTCIWGPDANDFQPERFLGKAADESPSSFQPMMPMPMPAGVPATAFTAFGGGVRPCIGRPLAIAEMKLALLELVSRFSLEEMEPAKFKMKFKIPLISPEKGLCLVLHPRS